MTKHELVEDALRDLLAVAVQIQIEHATHVLLAPWLREKLNEAIATARKALKGGDTMVENKEKGLYSLVADLEVLPAFNQPARQAMIRIIELLMERLDMLEDKVEKCQGRPRI